MIEANIRSDTNAIITAYRSFVKGDLEGSDLFFSLIENLDEETKIDVIENLVSIVAALHELFSIATGVDADKLWTNFCTVTQSHIIEEGNEND